MRQMKKKSTKEVEIKIFECQYLNRCKSDACLPPIQRVVRENKRAVVPLSGFCLESVTLVSRIYGKKEEKKKEKSRRTISAPYM